MAEESTSQESQEVDETKSQDDVDYKAKYEAMKAHSREWERKAKENQGASEELQKLKEQSLTEQEKAEAKAKRAREELEAYKAREEHHKAIADVASESGVSIEFVEMLPGSDEEELRYQVFWSSDILTGTQTQGEDVETIHKIKTGGLLRLLTYAFSGS